MKDRIIGGFRIERELRNCVWPSSGVGTRTIPAFKAICINAHEGIADVGDEVSLMVIIGIDDGDGEVKKRIERRIAELSTLSHPNIVRYRGCFVAHGTFNDAVVIVQDFDEGETLKGRIAKQSNGIDTEVCIDIIRQTLDALAYIQSCGVAHCNITPESILLCDDGGVKLTSFALPQWWSDCTVSPASCLFADYWAPELISGKPCGDMQSDIFSLGVVLHEMLCGKRPYQKLNGKEELAFCLERWSHYQSDGENPIRVSPRIRWLLVHAEEVFAKSLAPNREDRYPDFAAFRAGLKTIRCRDLQNGMDYLSGGNGLSSFARWKCGVCGFF